MSREPCLMSTRDEGTPNPKEREWALRGHTAQRERWPQEGGCSGPGDQTLLPPGPWRAVGLCPCQARAGAGWGSVGADSCGVGGVLWVLGRGLD